MWACCRKWAPMAFKQSAKPSTHSLVFWSCRSEGHGGQESGSKEAPRVILMQVNSPCCEKQWIERLKWCPSLRTYLKLNAENNSFKQRHYKLNSKEIPLCSYSSTGGLPCDIRVLKCGIFFFQLLKLFTRSHNEFMQIMIHKWPDKLNILCMIDRGRGRLNIDAISPNAIYFPIFGS